MKVVKAAAQVLNTLWQYRDLRNIYKTVNFLASASERLFVSLQNRFFSQLSSLMRVCLCSSHQEGWNQNHFITPVSTLERDRYRSQPTLPTSTLQMSPVIQSGERAAKRTEWGKEVEPVFM